MGKHDRFRLIFLEVDKSNHRITRVEVPANNVAKSTVIQAFEPLAGNFPKVTEKKAVHEIPKTENFWKVIQKSLSLAEANG